MAGEREKSEPASHIVDALRQTRLLAMDVDGVLTDGILSMDSAGNEQKRFHVHDGMGLTLVRQAGISVAWFSGRSNPIVERRAQDLRIPYVVQGVTDKGLALAELQAALNIATWETVYIGDDWNDLPAFDRAGVTVAVADAMPEVIENASLVTTLPGGRGAVREVCMAILKARYRTDDLLSDDDEGPNLLREYLNAFQQGNQGNDANRSGQ